MQIKIRADSVEITGYVNSIERNSKPLWSRMGRFIERIAKGAFSRALKRNNNVRILLNHDWNRDLGGQKDGNLELCEDAIGLKARAVITDKEVIDKARRGDLVGWSFGFSDVDVESQLENGMPTRYVRDLELYEVSILDKTKTPAYDGTLVSVRSDEDCHYFGDTFEDEIEVRELEEVEEPEVEEAEEVQTEVRSDEDEPKQHESVDYSPYEDTLRQMKEDASNVSEEA